MTQEAVKASKSARGSREIEGGGDEEGKRGQRRKGTGRKGKPEKQRPWVASARKKGRGRPTRGSTEKKGRNKSETPHRHRSARKEREEEEEGSDVGERAEERTSHRGESNNVVDSDPQKRRTKHDPRAGKAKRRHVRSEPKQQGDEAAATLNGEKQEA